MAAHPFGPIEKSLIVGYYSRQKQTSFDLRWIRFKFTNSKNHMVSNQEKAWILGFLEPRFVEESSGRSGDRDFRVTYDFKMTETADLLSRGLGYRITFTMPEESIQLQEKIS